MIHLNKIRIISCILVSFLWYTTVFSQQAVLTLPYGQVDGIDGEVFSNDGKYALTISAFVNMWDVYKGKFLRSLNHKEQVVNAFFSSNSKLVISADDSSIYIWNSFTGEKLTDFKPYDDDEIDYLKKSRSGAWFASGSIGASESKMTVYNTANYKRSYKF